jgi:N-acetylglucosaminyldiphosphoundecaprenol N-acetyl-beta-D-mannosaminyltransferase
MNNEVIDVLGVKVNVTNLASACQTIGQWIRSKQKTYVCVAPVSTIVDCQSDPQYRAIVNNAGMITPDGMPLVWLGKMKGKKIIERTYGPDLLLSLCQESQEKGYRHYFYGGSTQTIQRLMERLKEQFPKLNIAGSFSPAVPDRQSLESDAVLAQINAANPDILWVGLGSPKQDYWMHNHRSRLNVPVMIGIGAAFDFLAGTKRQAPVWMQRSGLEWFFRLLCEPRRLWRRYLVGNTQFIYLLLKDSLKNRLSGHVASS